MFVEEGFRIRFANGEVIDFYAENAEQKEGWMKVLSETVGKDVGTGKKWTQLVLEKERRDKMRSKLAPQLAQAKALKETSMNPTAQRERERPRSQPEKHQSGARTAPSSPQKQQGPGSRTAPSSPQKQDRRPPPVEKDPRHQAGAPRGKTGTGRRDQVRSMIF